MAFGWLKKAVRSAGKVAKGAVKVAVAPVKLVAKAGRTVGKTLGKVPIVGGGLKGVFDLTLNAPFQVAGQIASGVRIDKVALNAVKAHVRQVKAVAPYAQTVISLVPAVGPGVSAGIGAGLALASGQPITAAITEGIKSALPGGALAKSVFNVSQALVEGKSIPSAAINALPLGSKEKQALRIGLNVTIGLAQGKRVDKVLISQADRALAILPKDTLKALQIGSAVGEAKRLQKIAGKHVSAAGLNKLKSAGNNVIRSSPVLSAASSIIKSPAAKAGYQVGAAVMATKKPQPFHTAAIRSKMKPGAQRAGFDTAVAAYNGMAISRLRTPIKATTSAQKLGYFVTKGISKTSTAPKIIKAVKTNPATKAGTAKAIEEIQAKPTSLWRKFKIWLLGE